MEAHIGDRIVLESERTGQPAREGQIVEVIGKADAVRYRIRWTDGHESVLFPSAGNVTVTHTRKEKAAGRR